MQLSQIRAKNKPPQKHKLAGLMKVAAEAGSNKVGRFRIGLEMAVLDVWRDGGEL